MQALTVKQSGISLNPFRLPVLLCPKGIRGSLPFICPLHPVISNISIDEFWMINLMQLVKSTNNLVRLPSSDTPPTTGPEDSDPLFSRGFFLSLLLS